jgi:hypothetical protein
VPSIDGDAVEEDADGQLEEHGCWNVEQLAQPPEYEGGLGSIWLQIVQVLAGAINNAACLADDVCGEETLNRLVSFFLLSPEQVGLTSEQAISQSSVPHDRSRKPRT